MRLDFTFDPNSTSPLPAMELISAIDGKYSPRSLDGIRNPKALYNISVRETVSIATDLIDSILSISDDKENFSKNFLSSGQILSQTKLFILAVEQHLDACEKIISSFAPDDKKAGKMNREFRSSLGFYYKHVCVQANHIKHRHSQIRPLCLVSDVGHVPGYFLESGIGDKSAGPDPIIHNNGNTAFSFNREIKNFCIGMVFTSRCLSSIVKNNINFEKTNVSNVTADEFIALMNKSILLPNLFFPDEYKKDVVEITSKAGKIHASIGSKKSLRNPYGFVNFKTQLSMDGSTRTFGLPYLSTLEK